MKWFSWALRFAQGHFARCPHLYLDIADQEQGVLGCHVFSDFNISHVLSES